MHQICFIGARFGEFAKFVLGKSKAGSESSNLLPIFRILMCLLNRLPVGSETRRKLVKFTSFLKIRFKLVKFAVWFIEAKFNAGRSNLPVRFKQIG